MSDLNERLRLAAARVAEAEAEADDSATTEGAFRPPKMTKSLAKQIAKRLDKHWTTNVKSLDDIRRVLAAGILKPMSMSDLIDNQEAVTKWANSLSKDDLKTMLRMIEDAHWKGRKVQYSLSDKAFDKLASVGTTTEAAPFDKALMRDLRLTIDNDGQLYRQQKQPIIVNLLRKIIKDKYNHKMAPKIWAYLVETGAKKYHKDSNMSGKWSDTFPKKMRLEIAQEMADDFIDEVNAGDHDPKDYGVKGELPKKIKK